MADLLPIKMMLDGCYQHIKTLVMFSPPAVVEPVDKAVQFDQWTFFTEALLSEISEVKCPVQLNRFL